MIDKQKFPDNFILGSSTSAFQIEGEGRTEWLGFTGIDGTPLKNGIEHYKKYREDLEYILYLGNAYRFSPDWSKLQEKPFDRLNAQACSHYKEILKVLKNNDKKVLLVLNHFSNPLWMYQRGCWTNGASSDFFVDYARKVLDAFSEYIDIVNTFNEPNAYVNLAYLFRTFQPKKINLILRKKALANMREAHRRTYFYIKENYPSILVGISHANIIFQPVKPCGPVCAGIKKFFDIFQQENVHEFFLNNGLLADYIGFSYYGRILLEKFPLVAYEERGRKRLDELAITHDDMWELYPEGIYDAIRFFYEKYKKPLLITENGTCTDDDSLRKINLYNHLKYIGRACDENIPVLGYFHWSTFDNFELAHGPSRRFGLTSVNFKSGNYERKIKESGHYYHKVIADNCLNKP